MQRAPDRVYTSATRSPPNHVAWSVELAIDRATRRLGVLDVGGTVTLIRYSGSVNDQSRRAAAIRTGQGESRSCYSPEMVPVSVFAFLTLGCPRLLLKRQNAE
jgi:hypothetical protein